MLRILSAAIVLAIASASFAQTQSGQTTPGTTGTETPAITPSQAPYVTPSTGAPIVGGPAPVAGGIEERSIGGLSKCENLLAFEREKCLQGESAAAGGSVAPSSPGTGTSIMGPQNTAPAGTVR